MTADYSPTGAGYGAAARFIAFAVSAATAAAAAEAAAAAVIAAAAPESEVVAAGAAPKPAADDDDDMDDLNLEDELAKELSVLKQKCGNGGHGTTRKRFMSVSSGCRVSAVQHFTNSAPPSHLWRVGRLAWGYNTSLHKLAVAGRWEACPGNEDEERASTAGWNRRG